MTKINITTNSKTKIFQNHQAFLDRADKTQNGVSLDFSKNYPDWDIDNQTNIGCWNCRLCNTCVDCQHCWICWNCKRCYTCVDCDYCFICYDLEKCTKEQRVY